MSVSLEELHTAVKVFELQMMAGNLRLPQPTERVARRHSSEQLGESEDKFCNSPMTGSGSVAGTADCCEWSDINSVREEQVCIKVDTCSQGSPASHLPDAGGEREPCL